MIGEGRLGGLAIAAGVMLGAAWQGAFGRRGAAAAAPIPAASTGAPGADPRGVPGL
jgi:hypothetical protein